MQYLKKLIVVPHRRPHPDEAGLYLLLQREGRGVFPGFGPDTVLGFELVQPGKDYASTDDIAYICVGFGGGDFDDHVRVAKGEPKGPSATWIMAKMLGIEKAEKYQLLLRAVNTDDNATWSENGLKRTELDLGVIMAGAHMVDSSEEGQLRTFELALQILGMVQAKAEAAIAAKERALLNETMLCEEVATSYGRPVKIGFVCATEGEERILRDCCQLLIVRRPEGAELGHVQIFPHLGSKLPWHKLAGQIRILDYMLRHKVADIPVTWKRLTEHPVTGEPIPCYEQPGSIEGSPWFLMEGTNSLMCGSATHPFGEGTPLTDGQLMKLAMKVVSTM